MQPMTMCAIFFLLGPLRSDSICTLPCCRLLLRSKEEANAELAMEARLISEHADKLRSMSARQLGN